MIQPAIILWFRLNVDQFIFKVKLNYYLPFTFITHPGCLYFLVPEKTLSLKSKKYERKQCAVSGQLLFYFVFLLVT